MSSADRTHRNQSAPSIQGARIIALMLVVAFTVVGQVAAQQLYPAPYREYRLNGEAVDYLHGFNSNTGYGFIDVDGEVVIDPLFSKVKPFSEGLAAAEISGQYFHFHRDSFSDEELRRWGYLDDYNRLQNPGHWGYIDTTGRLVIPPVYMSAGSFVDGLARVWYQVEGATSWEPLISELIDPTGAVRFEFELAEEVNQRTPFHNGLAAVSKELDSYHSEFGFMNTRGEIVIDFTERDTGDFVFRDGLVAFSVDGGRFGVYREWGYMDRDGRTVIEPMHLIPQQSFAGNNTGPWEMYGFSSGLAAVGEWTEDRQRIDWYYINAENQKVLGPYAYAYTFAEGLAQVRLRDGRRVFIDISGAVQFEIDTELIDKVGTFSEGLLRVYRVDYDNSMSPFGDRYYGYLDEKGKMTIDMTFEGANDFHGDLARVSDGYIDKTGAYVWTER